MNRKLLKKLALTVAVVSMLSMSMTAFAAETYTVKSGDSLKKIAKQVYGDTAKWEEIYEANKAFIKNPNIIYVGQVFTIPGAEDTVVEQDKNEQTTENTTAAETETENTETTETAVKNVPVGENPVKSNYGYTYTFTDGSWVEYTAGDYVADAVDAYGVTYRECEAGRNASVMQVIVNYMAENPDSAFSNMIKENGNQFVIITSRGGLWNDEYDYDWRYGIVDCEPNNCVYMFVSGNDFEGSAIDGYGVQCIIDMIESISENIYFS